MLNGTCRKLPAGFSSFSLLFAVFLLGHSGVWGALFFSDPAAFHSFGSSSPFPARGVRLVVVGSSHVAADLELVSGTKSSSSPPKRKQACRVADTFCSWYGA